MYCFQWEYYPGGNIESGYATKEDAVKAAMDSIETWWREYVKLNDATKVKNGDWRSAFYDMDTWVHPENEPENRLWPVTPEDYAALYDLGEKVLNEMTTLSLSP